MICPNCQKEIAAGSKFCYNCGAKQAETPGPAAPSSQTTCRRFVRSTNNRKIAGVCAGVADYFDVDPTIIRVLWLLALLCFGTGLLAYLILWIAVPEGPTGVMRTSATAAP